jgi:adenine deaminase
MIIEANVVDIPSRQIYGASLHIQDGIITAITATGKTYTQYILPGFTDAHVHIESSLLVPSEFARMAILHGTVATVSDPHEIANVCGMQGVEFMIENGKQVPFHFFFGAPSCVPATSFETAGACVSAADVETLLKRDDIRYLSEMMNFPGVLQDDEQILKKIKTAHALGKPVDGHAPGLRGANLKKYIDAGISTDHECFTLEEAEEKLKLGMHVLIREGSAARNFDALIPLLNTYHNQIMFCSDDKHPDSLALGHINQLVARALAVGCDFFKTLQVACINPVVHYKLPVGLLKLGHPADFILTSDIKTFAVDETYIRGNCAARKGKTLIASVPVEPINQFICKAKQAADFSITPKHKQEGIVCLDGQLITDKLIVDAEACTPAQDILTIAVVNRYADASVACGFIKNMGIKSGAFASSVAHDSHNIVVVGVDTESMCRAVNLLIEAKGGLSAINAEEELVLPLPVAGLMSVADAWQVEQDYTRLDKLVKRMGSGLRAPFMSLSFMALLVIPHLKLSDKGLFDGDTFTFVT